MRSNPCDPSGSAAQHPARHGAGVFLVLVKHLAVDDRKFHSPRRHHHPPAAAGQIEDRLGSGAVGTHGLHIEDGEVGRQSGRKPAAVADAEKVGRLRGQAFDRVLQGQ